MPHRIAAVLLSAASVMVLACGGSDGNDGSGPSNSLQVTPQTLNLADCQVDTLVAVLNDGNGAPIPGATFTFLSNA